MDLKRMICVLTAVALLLPAIAVASANGSCKDWLGKWCITYFNTATTDNTTDKIHDNVTITTADNSTQTIGKFSYCCLAQGLRQSDSSPVSIVRQTVAQDDPPTIYIPENTYRYYLTADIVDLGPFDPFAQICAVNFYSTTFTTADLPFNCSGGTSSPDPGQEPNNLISGIKIVLQTYYRDADGDTYGNAAITTQAIYPPSGYVSNSTDCDDTNASKWRYMTGYVDADGDTYTVGGAVQVCTISSVFHGQTLYSIPGYQTTRSDNADCDDNNPSVHPGATEICNGIDDNCNGQTDEGLTGCHYSSSTLYSYASDNSTSTITAHNGACPTGALVLPDTLGGNPIVSIGDSVFRGCTGLTSVAIPGSVTSLGSSAFYGCTNLYNVHFLGNAPTMGTSVFDNHKIGFTVYYNTGATGFTEPWHTYLTAISTPVPTSAVWDRTTALTGLHTGFEQEPTLIYEAGHSQFFDNSTMIFKMWFHGNTTIPGTDTLNYAESIDGISWTRYGTILLSNVACPFVMKNNGTYYLFVSASSYSRVDEYTSSNGRNWTLAHSNIIAKGSNHSWNSGAFGNYSGIVLNNKLYLFVEATPDTTTNWRTGIYTSTDFLTFTDNGSNPIIANQVGGPSLPYLVGDTWWIWLHGVTIGTGLPSDGYRYSAPAITGPWAQNPSKITLPRATQDEGVGSSVGQVADPFILEVGGRTYLYYTANSDGTFTNADATAQIKVAIANMPISKLVTTDEYRLPSTTTAGSH